MIGSPTPTASPTTPTINPSTVVPLTIPTIVGTVGNSAKDVEQAGQSFCIA